jgi:serine/threonine protein kinase
MTTLLHLFSAPCFVYEHGSTHDMIHVDPVRDAAPPWVCAEVATYLNQPFQMTGGTGSYIFMAGEIFRHEPYNTKADIYSFGMVLYYMLTGQRPFAALDPLQAAMRAAVDGLRPDWPPVGPQYCAADLEALPQVQALVERCWSASPTVRCGTCIPGSHHMVWKRLCAAHICLGSQWSEALHNAFTFGQWPAHDALRL